MDSTINKYPFIDALRGWAILGVIFFHSVMFWIDPPQASVAWVAWQGQRGVQLFLVISAFTLFLSMETRQSRESRPFTNFFVRRFFRIAPLYYVAIVIYLSISGFGMNNWAPKGIRWWYVPANVLFVHGWIPEAINSVVPGGWTIAVEATFYSIFPVLYRRVRNIGSTLLFIVISAAAVKPLAALAEQVLRPWYAQLAIFPPMYTGVWFFSQAPLFGFGILAFHLFRTYRTHRSRKAGAILLLLSFMLAVSYLFFGTQLLSWQVPIGGAFCMLVLSLHLYPNRLMVNGAMQWLGKLSYSIYLVHLLVMNALYQHFGANSILTGPHGFYVVLGVTLILSTAIAAATYRLIEVPGMRLGRMIIARIERGAAGNVVADIQP